MEKLKIENTIKQKIWLSNELFETYFPCIGGECISLQARKRSYSLWNHANTLIQNATNDFNLEDGIIDLKRALNHRLKLIEELYGFKKNIPEYKNIPYLDILEKLSIVKPSLLKKLLIIRNDIEHNDSNAPEKSRCLELSDVVWYFLKSTVSICNTLYSDIEFLDEKDDARFFDIKINYMSPLHISIHGVLNKEDFFYSYHKSYLEVNLEEPLQYRNTDNIRFNGFFSKEFEQQELSLKLLFNICN